MAERPKSSPTEFSRAGRRTHDLTNELLHLIHFGAFSPDNEIKPIARMGGRAKARRINERR